MGDVRLLSAGAPAPTPDPTIASVRDGLSLHAVPALDADVAGALGRGVAIAGRSVPC